MKKLSIFQVIEQNGFQWLNVSRDGKNYFVTLSDEMKFSAHKAENDDIELGTLQIGATKIPAEVAWEGLMMSRKVKDYIQKLNEIDNLQNEFKKAGHQYY